MKKFRSKIVVVFVMLAMTICFAAASAQADDGPTNGSQGGTLSAGAAPPAPPAPTHDVDWYYLLMMLMFGWF